MTSFPSLLWKSSNFVMTYLKQCYDYSTSCNSREVGLQRGSHDFSATLVMKMTNELETKSWQQTQAMQWQPECKNILKMHHKGQMRLSLGNTTALHWFFRKSVQYYQTGSERISSTSAWGNLKYKCRNLFPIWWTEPNNHSVT